MLLAAVALVCLSAGFAYGSDETRHYSAIWFTLILGFAVGLLLIRLKWLEAWTQPGWSGSEIFCLAFCGVGLAALSYWCGMEHFLGFDCSAIVDVGWRLYCGQRPYVDFPCTLPIGFYRGAELAFVLFGVFWSSIVKLNVLYFLLTYFWTYMVLREVLQNRLLALMVVITCESMSLILVSYWWYNPITNMTVVLYGACVASVLLHPGKVWLWVSLCAALLLAALMKPNVSGIAIIGGTGSLLLNPRTRWWACVVSLIAFAFWLDILWVQYSNLIEVLGAYFSVASRGMTTQYFLEGLYTLDKCLAWLCVCLVLPGWVRAAWLKRPLRRRPAFMVLAGFLLLACLYGFFNNAEAKLVDLPVGVLAATILLGEVQADGRSLRFSTGWLSYLVLICSIFTFASLGHAVIRHRTIPGAMGIYYEYHTQEPAIASGFFKGLHTGHNLRVTLDALSNLCRTQNVAHIYFGPCLQWAYAAYDLPSPKGQPPWYDPGMSFPRSDEKSVMAPLLNGEFDPIVLQDPSSMGLQMLTVLSHSYTVVRLYRQPPPIAFPLLIVLTHKKVAHAAAASKS
jgi:hypothetical protein